MNLRGRPPECCSCWQETLDTKLASVTNGHRGMPSLEQARPPFAGSGISEPCANGVAAFHSTETEKLLRWPFGSLLVSFFS